MPTPNRRSLCKRKKFNVSEFCDSLIATNYYQMIKTTPLSECLRSVAFNYFNFHPSKSKKYIHSMTNLCRYYLSTHNNEIDVYFATYFNGPKLNIPNKFNLKFTYLEILQNEKTFNYNLRNNIYDHFQNINYMCILTDNYKNIKVNKPFIVIKFKCSFPDCPASYNFFLKNDDLSDKSELIFSVEQSGPILHRKGVEKANFISKNKRTEVAIKLIESKKCAGNFFYDTVGRVTDEMLDNAANIKKFTATKEVLRRIKSEHIKKSRLDSCPIMEIIKFKKMQQDDNINYIRDICYSPFKVYLFHENMFDSVIVNELKFKKFLDIHIDCTGSLFHKFTQKRAFYYLPFFLCGLVSTWSTCPRPETPIAT